MVDSTLPVMKRISFLLGRLSVSRKLLLIYLLDLSAVIFITSILIEEKYIAINFARKELQGMAYINTVREALFATVSMHDGHDAPALVQLDGMLKKVLIFRETSAICV